MNYKQIKENLNINGYCIIPNILNPNEIFIAKELFYEWYNSIPNLDNLHKKIDPHGIFKFHQAGHQEFSWYLRTKPQIIDLFANIWNTTHDNLTCSFDGSCYIPNNTICNTKCWTHTDQAPKETNLICYQGFVSLTNNKDNTLMLYKNSHKLHQSYFVNKEKVLQQEATSIIEQIKNLQQNNESYIENIKILETKLSSIKDKIIKLNKDKSKNWQLIDPSFLDTIIDDKIILNIPAGSFVLWDSRTFHQNIVSNKNEERIVQYICMLPKTKKYTKAQQKKKFEYFKTLRTTSHWPYPVKVNSLQPQTYGNPDLLIDYDTLPKPNLDKYLDIIKTLL
jgi:hypothetical protein